MTSTSPTSGVAGAVRVLKLSAQALAAMDAHGKRLDKTGKARAISDDPAVTTTGLELVNLHAAHVAGAALRKGAPKALHLVIQFPKALVDGEDADLMLDHARIFAEIIFGDTAIFADRVDRDEKSRHVVDLFIAPRYEKITKRGSKPAISTAKHLKELAVSYDRAPTLRGQGQALQDAWTDYLRDAMGLDAKRGTPKVRPGDDRLTAELLEANRLQDEVSRLDAEIEVKSSKLSELTNKLADLTRTLTQQAWAQVNKIAELWEKVRHVPDVFVQAHNLNTALIEEMALTLDYLEHADTTVKNDKGEDIPILDHTIARSHARAKRMNERTAEPSPMKGPG